MAFPAPDSSRVSALESKERRHARRDKRPYAANSRALDSTDIHSPFRLLTKQIKLCICINASNIPPDMHTHLHMEIHLQEKSELYLKQKNHLTIHRATPVYICHSLAKLESFQGKLCPGFIFRKKNVCPPEPPCSVH